MVKLEAEIKKFGCVFRLVERTDLAAIYSKWTKIDKKLVHTSYEVFRIKIRQAHYINDYSYPESEIFPSHESFGKWAWSFGKNYKDKAYELFESIKNGESLKKETKRITFGKNYEIIYYPDKQTAMVLQDGKLHQKQKSVIMGYYMAVNKLSFEDVKDMTIKEMSIKIFEKV